jgi:hypothetical protein
MTDRRVADPARDKGCLLGGDLFGLRELLPMQASRWPKECPGPLLLGALDPASQRIGGPLVSKTNRPYRTRRRLPLT